MSTKNESCWVAFFVLIFFCNLNSLPDKKKIWDYRKKANKSVFLPQLPFFCSRKKVAIKVALIRHASYFPNIFKKSRKNNSAPGRLQCKNKKSLIGLKKYARSSQSFFKINSYKKKPSFKDFGRSKDINKVFLVPINPYENQVDELNIDKLYVGKKAHFWRLLNEIPKTPDEQAWRQLRTAFSYGYQLSTRCRIRR